MENDKKFLFLELLADFQTMYSCLQAACEDQPFFEHNGEKFDRDFLNERGYKLMDKWTPYILGIAKNSIGTLFDEDEELLNGKPYRDEQEEKNMKQTKPYKFKNLIFDAIKRRVVNLFIK